jgi:hypothetical protein
MARKEPRHTPSEHHPSPEYFGEAGLYKPGDHMMGGRDRFDPVPDSEHGELKGSKDNQHPATSGHDLRYFSERHPSSTDGSRRVRQGDGPARDTFDPRFFSNFPAGSDSRSRG